jgi:hypothetical protein
MIRPILAAALLASVAGLVDPAPAQAQQVNCLTAGKLQITHIGRNQMTGGEGGGLAISVLIFNPQNTAQRFTLTYTGPARYKVTNQELTRTPYQRSSEWVATVSGGSSITDDQVRQYVTLTCF